MSRVEFGMWVNQIRLALGLSLRELGDIVGYSHSHVRNIESAVSTPSSEFCRKFADLIGADREEVERYAGIIESNSIPKKPTTAPLFHALTLRFNEIVINSSEEDKKIISRLIEMLELYNKKAA